MSYTVAFAPEAIADLEALFDYILDAAGERIARDYVSKIHDYCLTFETFPHRGSSRDDLLPGLRLVGFQHRATIAFLVEERRISIIRVFYGGRDIHVDVF